MATIELDDLKQVHRGTWAAGDYAAVSDAITEPVAPKMIEHIGVDSGHDVLDVATGTGNVALQAAAAGARTTGLDLVPELLETARRRAAQSGIGVEWITGDVEDLPFAEASFDRVFSAFGVQFAPRHAATADELLRVTRPGGAVVLANWTPEGQVGEMFKILGRYLPPAPAYASAPPLWGNEDHVRSLFGRDIEFERHTTPVDFDSAEAYVAFMETCYGPMIKARERLTGEGRWDECRAELVGMMQRRNDAADGSLHVEAEYALIVVRR